MLMRVASTTHPGDLAGAIAGRLRDHFEGRLAKSDNGEIVLQTIGASALNQAMKGVATARQMLLEACIDLSLSPRWVEVEIEGGLKRAALQFHVRAERQQ